MSRVRRRQHCPQFEWPHPEFINPPGNRKAKFLLNPQAPATADEWLAGAQATPDSWSTGATARGPLGRGRAAPASLGNEGFLARGRARTYVHDR
jgi:poly(3-hydroxyalkanoate) synthetase